MPTAFITLEPLAVLDERDQKTEMPIGTMLMFDALPEPGSLVYCARVGHALGSADVDPRRYIIPYPMWAKSMMPNDKGWANVVKIMLRKLKISFTIVGPVKGTGRPREITVDNSIISAMSRGSWKPPYDTEKLCVSVTFKDELGKEKMLDMASPYAILSSLRHSQ